MSTFPMTTIARVTGDALGAVFGALAAVRRGKPIHPRGRVVRGRLERTGAPEPWGVPWLDEPSVDEGVVRLSRAVGLPDGWPDVLGLAIRFTGDGEDHDLLLATTGLGALTRYVLVPRIDPATAVYSSLLPFDTPRGRALLSATPEEPQAGAPVFAVHVAQPRGPWHRFATLRLDLDPADAGDAALEFDPVHNPPPGLSFPPALAALRAPSYRAAQLARVPTP